MNSKPLSPTAAPLAPAVVVNESPNPIPGPANRPGPHDRTRDSLTTNPSAVDVDTEPERL
jgi:hypothetical protein